MFNISNKDLEDWDEDGRVLVISSEEEEPSRTASVQPVEDLSDHRAEISVPHAALDFGPGTRKGHAEMRRLPDQT